MAASVRAMRRMHALRELRRAKAAARKVRWPRGFHGAVMWCPLCQAELTRIPDGESMPKEEQQRLADEHRAVCKAVS